MKKKRIKVKNVPDGPHAKNIAIFRYFGEKAAWIGKRNLKKPAIFITDEKVFGERYEALY